MKKLLCILIGTALLISSFAISAVAENDQQYQPKSNQICDVNGDGSLNMKDVLVLRKFMAGYNIKTIYENSDLNGDCIINTKDLLLMRKALAGMNVQLSEPFSAPSKDISDSIEDMGIMYSGEWGDYDYNKILARNPFDMASYNGRVYFSCGNYDSNEGPITLQYLTRTSSRAMKSSGSLQTEQINKFYKFDDSLFALAIDPIAWLTGQYYVISGGNNRWKTRNVFTNNIHCYDMAKHNGKYFFAGSNDKTMISEEWGDEREHSVGVVFSYDPVKDEKFSNASSYYTTVPFIDKNGDEIKYTSTGVPRVYELVEFKGTLYAYYYDYVYDAFGKEYPEFYPTDKDPSGMYEYNDELNRFEYRSDLTIKQAFDGEGFRKEGDAVMRDFEWDDDYVVVNGKIFLTKDLKTWQTADVKGYDDYVFTDVLTIGEKLCFSAYKQNSDGSYTNVVLKSNDLVSFRELFRFNTKSWVRSFEYCDGAFFFGVGTSNSKAKEGAEESKECGRAYRYCYYN